MNKKRKKWRKIRSLNSSKYKYIPNAQALKEYSEYRKLFYKCIKDSVISDEHIIKSFRNWLDTEI